MVTNSTSVNNKLANKQLYLQPIFKSIFSDDASGGISTDFIKAFRLEKFEKGDSITTIKNTNVGGDINQNEYFYFVCQGKIRLVSFNDKQERPVSVYLLTEGDCFGADCLWNRVVNSYEAIASSSVLVAKIAAKNLIPWLKQLKQLNEYCLIKSKQRQALVFIKSLTELAHIPSHTLQLLLPHFKEKVITAGKPLPSPNLGHFWLRAGKVENLNLDMGYSWGYPEKNTSEWVAQTNLYVYYVTPRAWDNFQEMLKTPHKKSTRTIKEFLPVSINETSAPQLANNNHHQLAIAQENIAPIQFPKPLRHRHKFFPRYPFIEQQSAADCGPTCLAMISQYWGKRLSINMLRNLANVGKSGSSLKNLAKTAEKIGYQARPVRASFNSLLEQKKPWIAHWQGDHYVVVYKVKGDRILIADPAKNKKFITHKEFLAGWTGYALLLEPTEILNQIPNEKPSLGKFLKLLTPYKSIAIEIIVVSFLIQLFGVISPLFTQIILDQVVVSKSFTGLNVFALGVLFFGVWTIILSGIRQYLLSYLSNRLDLTMISGFIRHTLLLPLKFFEFRHVGDIITRVNENQKIQRFLLNQVVLAWLDFLMAFVYLGLMLYYNWQLTMLILALIPPIMILTLGATPLLRRVSREVFSRSAEQNSALVETISGVATIKATATERELRWRWEEHLTSYLNARFRSQKLGINLQAASGLINSLGSTALLWYGASLVIQDQLTIGQFVAFNMMIGKVINPVLALTNLWDELQEVLISVERLNDIFSAQPEENPGQPMLVLPAIKGDIKFDNVTFRYESDQERNTLQNISFKVKAGQTVAIVGRSGSGKSTLVKLLQGLYYPDSGSISIDGHNIEHISPHSLRSQLGVVPQECYLFSGTIIENITLYRPEFSLEQVIEVAKLAEAHPFIQSLPLGYNTKVGERGMNFSGGQRQRIAIARSLLGESRILILDEATSSLDSESERRFQDNLTRMSRNRTTFIIAHRLSTVRNVDHILVLDRGIIVEQGNHHQLMKSQGLYFYLVQQQLNL
ncbi:bacteriocin-processing peptidase [Cyanobacterium stanieri PCC 7202]|uniref:Bacteriocin-processing peptidase n=1 Tax=Cyanobacterium stanieri (strain ATCC 29140 / PCC 7202) TaxID=292563 RepID=K9YIE1_CYASC|nr:bacteriocin-processing peptidase [Cyanobacterium stanieri PCC 7202]